MGIFMKAIRFAILCALALFVAACLPVTSDNPIGSTVGFRPDPALLGVWKGRGSGKEPEDMKYAYFAFFRNDDGVGMSAMLMTFESDADQWTVYDAQVATLGANHIMNVRERSQNGTSANEEDARQLIPVRYDIGKDGKLTLSLLDDKATAAAIKAGKLKGTVQQGSENDGHITADPKSLDAFFASKQGAALFSAKLVTLVRVR
jgi:hypothetical protein